MNPNKLFDRARGALIGCAMGDAMGMPTEMMTWEDMDALYPDGIRSFHPTSDRDFIGRSMLAGEVTDDTINTVLLAELIIREKGDISAEKYITCLRNWVKENAGKAMFVAGPSTMRALEAIEQGTPITKSGLFGRTNGAAMKMSPLGILCDYRDRKGLADCVEQICMPTHNTGVAIAGACVVAACVSYGVRGGEDADMLWDVALDAAAEGEKRGFRFPSASLGERIKLVRDAVRHDSKETVIEKLKYVYGTSEQTLETIPAALAIATVAELVPIEACSISATIGGDTDTIGAISGAICGSMNPVFPADLIVQLEQVNGIDFEALARGLVDCMS